MKEVTFTQSLAVDTEITLMVPDDWTDEDIRLYGEDFPVVVTVDPNEQAVYDMENADDVMLVNIAVPSAISQPDFSIVERKDNGLG